jgi:hypothetical protein
MSIETIRAGDVEQGYEVNSPGHRDRFHTIKAVELVEDFPGQVKLITDWGGALRLDAETVLHRRIKGASEETSAG